MTKEQYTEALLSEENARLKEEIEGYKSTMIAAAEEIMRCWKAHCDEEGYGPSNLLHRLESGIPAHYGYKAGDFQKLEQENARLTERLKAYEEKPRKTFAERLDEEMKKSS